MGRSEAGLTAACTVIQDLKRWQGSGVWLLAWQPQSWPQELLQINQLRMVKLQSLNLSSKKVTFRSLNKLGNKERLSQERVRKKGKVKEEMQRRQEKERKDQEKIEPVKEINQIAREREMEKEERQIVSQEKRKKEGQEKIKRDEQRNQRKINK